MTRRRYVQIKGELVEITDDYQPERHNDSGALWGDRSYDGLRATDGTDISTRAKHREYMKLNNLTTVDDFKETWSKAQEQRDRYRQSGGTFSKRDIERAISQLQRR